MILPRALPSPPGASLAWARLAAGFALWLGVSGAGYAGLARYAHVPGVTGRLAAALPGSPALPRAGKPTLVLVLHPECPCSRASLAELARLLTRLGGRVVAVAVFVRPEGTPPGWERGELWDAAARVPGLTSVVDDDGALAAQLGAATSGHALLFDAGGALAFSGGITESRGHVGDAEGQEAIVAQVERGAGVARAPVYGCPLASPRSEGVAP